MKYEKTFNVFDSRAFVAIMISLSGLSLPITGYVCHLYGFHPLSLSRHAWMSAHNAFGFLFAAFVLWHVALNRKARLNHVKSSTLKIPKLRRELLVATLAVALTLLLAVGHAFHAGR